MAGHGVILSDAYDELRELAERTGIPVITTLLGISAFPESHPLHLGMPGMHGEVHVNRAIQQADLIIGVGLRFDDRVTGNLAAFARGAKVIHIELDPSEVGKNVPVAVGLVGDARAMLRALLEARRAAALRRLAGRDRELRPAARGELQGRAVPGGDPGGASRSAPPAAAPSSRTWGSTRCGWRSCSATSGPTRHITSGGLGTMGFAVPAAMGVALARPGRAGVGHLGRRRVPDEHAGDRHHGAGADPGEDGDLQQRLPGHGAAVAAVLPRPPLLGDADLEPRLRPPGRGVRHPGLAGRARRSRWTARCARRWRSRARRWWSS